jgi:hypothetical protein
MGAFAFSRVRQQAVFLQFGKYLSVLGDCILMVLRLQTRCQGRCDQAVRLIDDVVAHIASLRNRPMLAGRRHSVESEGGLQELHEFRDLERPWNLSPRQQCLQCAAGQDRVPFAFA